MNDTRHSCDVNYPKGFYNMTEGNALSVNETKPTWPENEDERNLFYHWVNAVNDEFTCLGFREWLLEIDPLDYQ